MKEDGYLEALRSGKRIYDDNGNQYVWDEENKCIKMYYYIDADAIISGTKNITIEQFENLAKTLKLTV